MFIDSSALVAILIREEGYEKFLDKIEAFKGTRYISPLVRFEVTASFSRSLSGARRPTPELFAEVTQLVNATLEKLNVKEITITPTIGAHAITAAGEYGKIIGHKADLNFGDCFSYACAKAYHVSLIYKGNDFVETDLA
jgi:ribonuclease VapC